MYLTEFLLTDVKKRPGMYLMDAQLISLRKFITGYQFGLNNTRLGLPDMFIEFFSDWFLETTNNKPGYMWYPLILEECNYSEEKALNRFFEYLEEFDKFTKANNKL